MKLGRHAAQPYRHISVLVSIIPRWTCVTRVSCAGFAACLGIGFRAYPSRLARRGVLRGRGGGLGLLERDGSAPFRGVDSAQRAELAFLRFAQCGLVRPPRARVIAPSEKRQHGKGDRDERNHSQ